MKDIICICGPTASGKTGLAVALAKALDAEVVSCDSMQIYRGMDIGTAKPDAAEMDGVPHWLLDVAEPGEDFSVGRYVKLADAAIADVHARGKIAVVCGGTGLYMDSLIKGETFAAPSRPAQREYVEHIAEEKGVAYVYDMLKEADPETAEKLHLSDRKRIIRAMEVFLITGMPLSWHNEQSKKRPPKYEPAWIGLNFRDRNKLYARVDRRVDEMLEKGLEAEVRRLLEQGIDPKTTAMQAIGYKEMAAAIRGECSVKQAAERIKQASRNYAKRQLTWFRRNEAIRWLYVDETPELLPAALRLL
ncbi:MAG: tRNA (adenosine(37)-N6)-dimethylallyltransferase MiaA [Oscillospiraceae bacterium]|nr:tRNA (adenosine(37)-N6)-dimethylallyltransferase MiaA [Oscillospiraceae bacterium]MBR7010784.1 tRNA (adenosine(37)-N6)-dimethylallyltransferase MiaA [Oscillospiraceae bacterium]